MQGRVLLGVVLLVAAGCLQAPVGQDGDPTRVDERTEQLRGLLWTNRTREIEVVVHAQPGYGPAATSIQAVEEQFGILTGKPVHVTVRQEDYRFSDDKVWDAASLDAVRDPAFNKPWPAGKALVHVFALPGCYAYSQERPCIAAIAGRTATIFPKEAEGDLVPHEDVLRDVAVRGWYTAERYLYVHELGHVFGLVASPLPPVQDRVSETDCACHSVDPDSVMAIDGRGWRVSVSPDDPTEVFETVSHDDFQRYSFSARDIEDVRAFQDGN